MTKEQEKQLIIQILKPLVKKAIRREYLAKNPEQQLIWDKTIK